MTSPQTGDRLSPVNDQLPEGTSQSVGDLIGEVAGDVTKLFRHEIALAKAELKEEAAKAGKAGGMLTGAGVAGHLVALFLSFALVFALGAVIPLGWAALIVAVLWAVIGAILYSSGRRQMRTISPVPRQTVESIKEDMEWLRNPTG